MAVTPSQPDPSALSIAPADGYQYGDDHPSWTGAEQSQLVEWLGSLSGDTPDTPAS
jgi:hypothetical protein